MQTDRERLALFRQEAVDAVSDAFGSPLPANLVRSWVLMLLALGLVIAIAVFLVTGTYTRRETVSGRLIPRTGLVLAVAQRSGVVSELLVHQGDQVKVDQPLAVLSAESHLENGQSYSNTMMDAVLEQSAARLSQLDNDAQRQQEQRQTLARELALQQGQMSRLKDEIVLQQQRLDDLTQTVIDIEPAMRSQVIATVQYRQYVASKLDAAQTLSSLHRQLDAANAQYMDLLQKQSELNQSAADLAAKRSEEAGAVAERTVDLAAGSRLQVVSPITGYVASTSTDIGKPLAAGNVVAVLAPANDELVAELWVPSEAIGFVKRGADVNLMYTSFPYQRFGMAKGKVESLSQAPTTPELVELASQEHTEMFRVLVRIDHPYVDAYGDRWQLLAGTRLTADVVLERRSFWQWLIDPLRATWVRGRA